MVTQIRVVFKHPETYLSVLVYLLGGELGQHGMDSFNDACNLLMTYQNVSTIPFNCDFNG